MAFLSSSHPPHRSMPDVTVTLSPSDAGRMKDFSIATYATNGAMCAAKALADLPSRVDRATGWMWCRIPAELIHPSVSAAVALMDTAAQHLVTAFYALDCCAPGFTAVDGPAAGVASGCFPNSGGLPIPFDSAMTAETMQTSLLGGTMIDTPDGARLIDDLVVGDLVNTLDAGPQPLVAVHSQTFAGLPYRTDRRLWPVRVEAGALGFGLPQRDLWISQGQQMLYRHIRVRHVLGADAVLVQARSLAATLDSVRVDGDLKAITGYHLVFETPQVIFAEGAATSSYDPQARLQQQATDEDAAMPQIRSWELMAMVG
ncbi:Hint domain-containing protein [Yoonia sp. R2331]|uniref:Hint domain-containing protein n=1 Tax=Yoonia sp. R2331 TaxID=3237238 RepID=UPI0034E5606A